MMSSKVSIGINVHYGKDLERMLIDTFYQNFKACMSLPYFHSGKTEMSSTLIGTENKNGDQAEKSSTNS